MSNGFNSVKSTVKPVEVIPQLLYKDCKLPSMTFFGPVAPTGVCSHKPAFLSRTP